MIIHDDTLVEILKQFAHKAAELLDTGELDQFARFTVQRITGRYDFADTFDTPYDDNTEWAGEPFELVRSIELPGGHNVPNPWRDGVEVEVDPENLPMFVIRFTSGAEIMAFPEEVLDSRWAGYPEGHAHQWGDLRTSRLAGTLHRECKVSGCRVINALDDDPPEEDDEQP